MKWNKVDVVDVGELFEDGSAFVGEGEGEGLLGDEVEQVEMDLL